MPVTVTNGYAVTEDFQLSVNSLQSQDMPRLTALPNGNFVAVWMDMDSFNEPGIRARIYDGNGNPVGAEFQVPASAAARQIEPSVTALANGGFVISWGEESPYPAVMDIKAQVFDASGQKVGSEFIANTTTAGFQTDSQVIGLSGGGFAVIWAQAEDATFDNIRGQVFAADGTRIGGEFVVNDSRGGDKLAPTVSALSDGRFIVSWLDFEPNGQNLSHGTQAQIINADGSKSGAQFSLNDVVPGTQTHSALAGLPGGGFIGAWVDNGDGNPATKGVWAQAFDSAGNRIGSAQLVTSTASTSPLSLEYVAGKGVLLTWTSISGSVGTLNGQFLDTGAAQIGSSFQLGASRNSGKMIPDVAVLADGQIVFTWQDRLGSGADPDVRAQILFPMTYGTEGSDIFRGTDDRDFYDGLGGTDYIWGGGGADVLFGGDGDDYFRINAPSDLVAGDSMDGGNGTDILQLTSSMQPEIDLSQVSITSVEGLQAAGAGYYGTIVMTMAQLNGFSSFVDAVRVRLTTGGSATYGGTGFGTTPEYILANADTTLDLRAGIAMSRVTGGSGNDIIYAALGHGSTLYGGGGNDQLYTGNPGGTLYGGEGNDRLEGRAGNDRLYGENGDDTLYGGGGFDTLVGGAGRDEIYGGDADDTLIVESAAHLVAGEIYDGGTGMDTLQLNGGGSFDLSAVSLISVERIETSGTVTLTAAQLTGDILYIAGQVRIGTPGAIALTGNYNATFTLNAGGNSFDGSAATGGLSVVGSAANDTIIGNSAANTLNGGGGDDIVSGGGGNDSIRGGAGADTLSGGDGDDIFWYDAASDYVAGETIDGGAGFDIIRFTTPAAFSIDLSGAALTGIEGIDTGAYDASVRLTAAQLDALTAVSGNFVLTTGGTVTMAGVTSAYDLGNPSRLSFTLSAEGNVFDMTNYVTPFTNVYGQGGNDTIIGWTGTDIMYGGGGNDRLYGGSGADQLFGGDGDDYLDGGVGIDVMTGGAGNDTYIVDHSSDQVVEDANGGIDTVLTSLSYTLGNNVENLTLTGTLGNSATGNALDNILTGNAGDNRIDGKAGADTMIGGAGDDTYVVDNAGDIVVELAGEGIRDWVEASIDYTLGANVENLTLTGTARVGTGNELNNMIRGNALANTLSGGDGDDLLYGNDGDDTLIGGTGADLLDGGTGKDTADYSTAAAGMTVTLGQAATSAPGTSSDGDQLISIENLTGSIYWDVLTGNEIGNVLKGGGGNDTLTGNGGADVLDGGTGADLMIGGTEDDIYYVDDAGDRVVEDANGGNRDEVRSTLSSMRLGDHVEMLTYIGTGSFFAIGNDQGNNIVATSGSGHTIYGMGGDDGIFSGDGDDVLYGDDGDDVIYAGGGNDRLEGGAGADILLGMTGDDTYYVDRAGEVFESANEGNDTVVAGFDYTLDANVENLILIGAATRGTGNWLDNVITGTQHENLLEGGAGNDTLIGGGGLDVLRGGTGDDIYYVDRNGEVFENAGEGIDTVFADMAGGMYLLDANVENLTLQGTTFYGVGNELANVLIGSASTNWLMGGDGDDRLNGMGGDDVLYGDGGADTFVFGHGTGVDTVADFRSGTDKLDLSAFGFADFAAVLAVTQDDGSGNSFIDLGGGDRVVLRGVTKAQLASGDVVLTAASGVAALFAAEAAPGLLDGFDHQFDAGPELVRIGVVHDDAMLVHNLI